MQHLNPSLANTKPFTRGFFLNAWLYLSFLYTTFWHFSKEKKRLLTEFSLAAWQVSMVTNCKIALNKGCMSHGAQSEAEGCTNFH